MNLASVNVDFIKFGSTPLRMLLSIACLAIAAMIVAHLATPLAARWIDRRWPPTRELSPTERLWGDMEKYVRKTFGELELRIAQDLATRVERKDVSAGTYIVRQGERPTHYFWLKEGEAEVTQRDPKADPGAVTERVIRRYGPGSAFGEVAIVKQTARTASVRAVTDCVVLQLPADEFVTALELSAADAQALFRDVDRLLAEDRQRHAGSQPPPGET